MSISKVTSRTNGSFGELRQNQTLEATEPQLLDFLRNVAATNSALRVQSLSLRPTPDRSRLRVSMTIAGDYRLPAADRSREPDAAKSEYLVLSQRRHLREAALDCYNLTKSTLPVSWQLDSLNFHAEGGSARKGRLQPIRLACWKMSAPNSRRPRPRMGRICLSLRQARLRCGWRRGPA